MKKSFLFVAAMALVFASCGNEEVIKYVEHPADFEGIQLDADTLLHMDATGTFESGDFVFDQDVDVSDWGTYYYGNIVSGKKKTTYSNDWKNDMNVSGTGASGDNYVVWYYSYNGTDKVRLKSAAAIPGFFINNTPWVVYAILNGDGMSEEEGGKGLPFGANDYFTLTITGSRDGKPVNAKVTVDLARGTEYIHEWTYVSLAALGMVDELQFALDGSKHNKSGCTTPTYFAFDDLGAAAPEK